MSIFTSSRSAELHEFGSEIISKARELVLDLWKRSSISSELKDDQTPVSEVDLRCEEMVRAAIRARYPDHGVIGEEYGAENERSDLVWTIDPIDGTQNLVNRIPTFGTILGLLYRGEPVMGWIDHPVLGETLSGGPGVGTFRNGHKVVLTDLEGDALSPNDLIAANCPAVFERGGHIDALWKVLRLHPHSRIYYDVFSHTLTITGSIAVTVEYNLKIWDLAATRALIEGAGGVYREISRTPASDGYPTLYNAAFGKRRAVALVSEILG